MNSETEKWLREKLNRYTFNPNRTVEEMLHDTTEAIKQFTSSGGSKAAEDVLLSCAQHNELFLNKLEEIKSSDESFVKEDSASFSDEYNDYASIDFKKGENRLEVNFTDAHKTSSYYYYLTKDMIAKLKDWL